MGSNRAADEKKTLAVESWCFFLCSVGFVLICFFFWCWYVCFVLCVLVIVFWFYGFFFFKLMPHYNRVLCWSSLFDKV